MFKVKIKKKILKNVTKIPINVQQRFWELIQDLRVDGPHQINWPNFSKLGKNEYHCHLIHHWVFCWRYEKDSIIIEVYYAGSRKKAPY